MSFEQKDIQALYTAPLKISDIPLNFTYFTVYGSDGTSESILKERIDPDRFFYNSYINNYNISNIVIIYKV